MVQLLPKSRAAFAASAALLLIAASGARCETTDGNALEEVIVTAQKRAENIQSVPIAISALTGDQLKDQRVTNLQDLQSQIPNLALTLPYGNSIATFSLRGVSALDYGPNQSSPVALYVDEVYKGLPALTSLQLYDVDRVEVLRGPQGTLYGKNTTGGAVNFYTKTASLTDGFSGYLTAGAGNLGRFESTGALNIPLVDNVLATRVAYTIARADGFVENLVPGVDGPSSVDEWAARLSTTWAPNEAVEVILRLAASESTPTGYDVLDDHIGFYGPGGLGFTTGYTREGLSFFQNEDNHQGEQPVRNKSVSLHVTWDVTDDVTLTSVTAYDWGTWLADADEDGSPFNLLNIVPDSEAEAWSQDLRLASSGTGRLDWLVGLFGYSDKLKGRLDSRFLYEYAYEVDGVPGCFIDFFTGCVYSNQMLQKRDSYAAYGQLNWHVTDAFSVTAGLRYTHDENKLDYYRGYVGYLDPTTGIEYLDVVPTFTEPLVDSADESNVSGKLGFEYRFDDSTMLYGSLSRGYRGGAFNGQAQFSAEETAYADPETVDAIEAGLKTEPFDRAARLNLSAFYYRYKNQQYIDTTPTLSLVLKNAPESRVYGGEVELTARAARRLDIRLGASYLHGEYEKASLRGVDIAGNTMLLAPEWSVTGGIDWRIADTSFGDFSLHTYTRYTSKMYFDAFNTDRISQPDYTTHDARLSFAASGAPITVSAWITNLTDEHYRVYRVDVPSFNFDYAHRGRPREYGIEATYNF